MENCDIKTIPLDRAMAEVVIKALSIAYFEGQDVGEAEERLVRVIYFVYPEVMTEYEYLPIVKAVKETK
jgi:hypothetical protein